MPKELFCEKCGAQIRHPNRRFCDAHRRTQKEYMDEKKVKIDKRCPKCGVQIYHNTDTCWKCRPSSVKGKKIEKRKSPSSSKFFRKDNEPETDDEIRAFANRATEKILAKLGATENQIKYQLRDAKIRSGIAKTKFKIMPKDRQKIEMQR